MATKFIGNQGIKKVADLIMPRNKKKVNVLDPILSGTSPFDFIFFRS